MFLRKKLPTIVKKILPPFFSIGRSNFGLKY